ncbi:MAG: hypothetical protein MUC83_02885 [Pirellula sp.]|jgi:hypothetical protein|nr:hypothetical protein [Pirellula sp.]
MRISCLAIFLFLSNVSFASQPDEPDVAFYSYTGNDLFPSFLIATASVDWNGDEQRAEDKKRDEDSELEEGETPLFGDENGCIGVEIADVAEGSVIRVEMEGDDFLNESVWEGECNDDYDFIRVMPKVSWNYEALRGCTQQKPANLKIRVFIDDEEVAELNETIQLKAVSDCPFYVILDDEGASLDDISITFAAYVNENHPWVDGLLKEALDATKDQGLTGFTGYQMGSEDEVLLQVFAVWNALQRRGIKYSDISTNIPSKRVYSQSVRMLDETIKASQANCVDGSVLMASILRKIGMEVDLVMVPGHCLLAFANGDKENPTRFFLETTMLGNDDLQPVDNLPDLPETLKKGEFEASYATFAAALAAGKEHYINNEEAFQSQEDPNVQLISISAARNMGIIPLSAQSNSME